MKIFPLKVLTPLDKLNNFIDVIETAPVKQAALPDKEVEILNMKFSTRELRSIYRDCLKQLSRDEFNKCNNK